MDETKFFRIKNIETGKFHKSYNERTMWNVPYHAVRSFKHYYGKHPDEHPEWEMLEYKLVEVK